VADRIARAKVAEPAEEGLDSNEIVKNKKNSKRLRMAYLD
jgi:hypothetical protein